MKSDDVSLPKRSNQWGFSIYIIGSATNKDGLQEELGELILLKKLAVYVLAPMPCQKSQLPD